MKSPVVKRSVEVGGRTTSVSLEDEFWSRLRQIAFDQNISIQQLIFKIDSKREGSNLSSAIRLFVLDYYRSRSNARR
jgi:predicted DNA-binding ribbon-helix-helix protein